MTRGRAELAKKAVASALQQVPPPDLVWVIEDGLVGKPFEWEKGGPVRITRWSEPKGYMAARQKMMMEAEADVYVSLDDDAWFLDPHAMAEAVRAIVEHPQVAAVGFEILSPDQSNPSGKKGLKEAKLFIGCGHALHLMAVREVGGYENMPGFYGGEEKDLCLRLMDQGWKIVKVMGATVWHDKTHIQRDLRRQRKSRVVNDLTLICRRCPTRGLALNALGNITNQMFHSMQAPKERLGPSLAGIWKFLLAIPAVISTRRPVRSQTWRRFRRMR